MNYHSNILEYTKKYQYSNYSHALFQLIFNLLGLFCAYTLEFYFINYSLILFFLAMFMSAIFVLRIFIIQHDCVHWSFFKSPHANNTLGIFLGVLTMTPFYCWRRFHLQHHAHVGNLDKRGMGDINMLTVKEYVMLPWYKKLAYRLYRNPIILFIIGPALLFCIRQRFTYYIPKTWKRERQSVYITNILLACVFVLAYILPKVSILIIFFLFAEIIAASLGVWLFYVQHQFKGSYWKRAYDWSYIDAAIDGSSYYELPKILHWLTSYIGFHHIHHLNPKIPNYNLKKCFVENIDLQNVKKVSILESLLNTRLKLWDESSQSMIKFCQLRMGRKS